jgi:hypothetical protein
VVGELAEKQLVISLNSMAQDISFVNIFLHMQSELGGN